jgi:DNA-binding SARP family transcriptional activator
MDTAPTPTFLLSLLGGFDLRGPAGSIDLPSKKLIGLLAFLACTAPRAHSRDELMTMFWGSYFDPQARQNLRQALTRLRRLLGDGALVANAEMVSLRPGALACDVAQFETLLSQGTPDALKAAVALYRGSLLPDATIPEAAWTEWLGVLRQRLESLALDAMVKLAQQDLQAGRHQEALGFANRAAEVSSLREDAHRAIMQALAAGGRRADALKHYEDLAALLKRELAAEPDPETRALADRLRKGSEPGSGPWTPTATREPVAALLPLPDRPSLAVLPFGGAMVPTLALGIPGSTSTALILGAMIMHGLKPGPFLLQNQPEFLYAVFGAMIIANLAFMVVGLAGAKLFSQVTLIPRTLRPAAWPAPC